MKQLKKVESLSEQAFTLIRNAILDNVLVPGELYSATEIGKWIGASRTPVREAAQQLANVGMVRIEKNRGIRILPTSFEGLIESFQVRLMLEVPVIRQLAKCRTEEDRVKIEESYDNFYQAAKTDDPQKTLEADRDYHLTLLEAAGIERVIRIIEHSRNTVLLTGPSTVPHSRSCMEAFEDHRALHEAILAQDGERAAKEMRAHLINTAQMLIKQESEKREGWSESDLLTRLDWING